MKNIKKLFKLSFALVLTLVLLTGCGGDKTQPNEVATIFLDVITQKDQATEKAKEYYGDKSELDSFDAEMIKKEAIGQFNVPGFTTEQKAKLIDVLFDVMKKAEYTTENGDKEGMVTIKVKGVELQKVINDAQAELQKGASAGKYTTQGQALDAMIKIMVEKISKAEISDVEKTLEVEFEKKNGKWIPKNPEQFGSQAATKLMGM